MNELRVAELVTALLAVVGVFKLCKELNERDIRIAEIEKRISDNETIARRLIAASAGAQSKNEHQDKYARKLWLSIANITKRINKLEGKE